MKNQTQSYEGRSNGKALNEKPLKKHVGSGGAPAQAGNGHRTQSQNWKGKFGLLDQDKEDLGVRHVFERKKFTQARGKRARDMSYLEKKGRRDKQTVHSEKGKLEHVQTDRCIRETRAARSRGETYPLFLGLGGG